MLYNDTPAYAGHPNGNGARNNTSQSPIVVAAIGWDIIVLHTYHNCDHYNFPLMHSY